MCAADAVPSTSEPTAADEAEQSADPGDTADPGDAADALTGTHASSDPRDCRTLEKHSKKKRTSAENGSCASVEEDKQQSKRRKACSQSQTDRAAGQAHDEESRKERKLRQQPSCDVRHTEDGQHGGQHSGQYNGRHKTAGHSNEHHNGQPTHDGQSNGQAEAADSRQLRHSHSSPQQVRTVSLHPDSDPMSGSSLGEELTDEEEEEAADIKLGSLGNVDVATASRQVLSVSMLQGLKAGLQARLSLYATGTTAEDLQQLREVQEANARWDGPPVLTLPLPCPALPCPALPCPALPCPALPCLALPCPG